MPFPVEQKFIIATEERLGVRFPSDFVAKMLVENGGQVEALEDFWDLFPILDTSDRKRLKRTCNDIVQETMRVRELPHFPSDAVAIAADGGGDFLVFRKRDPARNELCNEIYWWCHETGELEVVANSFSELSQGKPGTFDF